MKNIYKIFGSMFFIFLLVGCDEDFSDNNEFAKNIAPPSNVSASFDITQDNTGDVTITPTGEGAISFVIDYGDGSPVSSSIKSGGSVKHTFKEGNHTIKVTATGLNNLTTISIGEVNTSASNINASTDKSIILSVVQSLFHFSFMRSLKDITHYPPPFAIIIAAI